jgi:TIR domain
MRVIFISYRREDAEGQAGRLFDDLTKHFGENAAFMDVAGIAAGRDFRRAIEEHVASCGVLLAIIGKYWIDARDESGRRRLEDPADFVRLETASALKRDIPVVPVLVHGARMPRKEQLPEDLAELTYRNCVELTHARWDSDVQVLIKAVSPYVDSEAGQPRSTGPRRIGRWLMTAAGLVAAIVMAIGGYAWYHSSSQKAEEQRLGEEIKQPVQSYPMTCRGGSALSITNDGGSGVRIGFQPGPGAASAGLAPGQCTWADRALHPPASQRPSATIGRGQPSMQPCSPTRTSM